MPKRPPHPCAYPGCPNLVHSGRFCSEHQPKQNRGYEQQRGSASQRGYGARWRRLRSLYLAANPLCADPFGDHAALGEVVAATDVDHILPKRMGGTDAWDNLQGLCHSCHSKKTSKEDGGFGNEKDL